MRRGRKSNAGTWAALIAVAVPAGAALAGGHTWDVNEVFSNADGTIQFIELWEANGGSTETGLNNKQVKSTSTGKTFVIVGNVAGDTANRHFLIATATFAALPGAPTPDRIIPAGSMPFFFNVAGDTVSYVGFDNWVFGAVPTDGINSRNRVGAIQPNSPTNYAGQTGSVNAGVLPPGDFDGDGDVDLDDYTHLADCLAGPEAAPAPGLPDVTEQDCLDAFDMDTDTDVDLQDFHAFQQNFDI